MLKLSQHRTATREPVIRIEGSLTAETVAQLLELATTKGLVLDLAGLTSIDQTGRAVLLQLRSAGSKLRGGSLYIQRLLEEV